MQEKSWLNVRNEGDGVTADIYLFDIIDSWFGIGKKSFVDSVKATGASHINVHISSPGGSVDDALAMHDFLKSYPATVHAYLTGVVASAATFLSAAADKVHMSENALYMIHNVWSWAVGTADEMRKEADTIDKFEERIIAIYQRKTGLRKSQIKSMLDEETWMDADEARSHGFVDKVVEASKLAAKVDLKNLQEKGFKNIPQDKLEKINSHIENMENKTILEKLEEGFKNLGTAIANIGKPKEPATSEKPEAATEIKVLDQAEVTALVDELKGNIETVRTENHTLTQVNATLQAENEALKAENARLSVGGVETPPPGDPNGDPNAKPDPWKTMAKELAGYVKSKKN